MKLIPIVHLVFYIYTNILPVKVLSSKVEIGSVAIWSRWKDSIASRRC